MSLARNSEEVAFFPSNKRVTCQRSRRPEAFLCGPQVTLHPLFRPGIRKGYRGFLRALDRTDPQECVHAETSKAHASPGWVSPVTASIPDNIPATNGLEILIGLSPMKMILM